MNQAEYRQLVEEYGGGFHALEAAVGEVPTEAWDFHPSTGEWNVKELLFHMADSETVGVTRLYMIVAQPGSTLMSYDDAAWGRALSYAGRNVDDALKLFRLLRQSTHALLRSLPELAFNHSVIHPDNVYPEYGEAYNVEKWLRIYTRHVRDHITQLQSIHQTWKGH